MKVKRQHYVPRMYLKRFCIPGRSDQVHVYDKVRERKFKSSIQNVASENYFYDFDGDDVLAELGVQPLENFFSMAEGIYSQNLEALLANVGEVGSFPLQNKQNFSRYVLMQMTRTKQYRADKDAELYNTVLRKLLTLQVTCQLRLPPPYDQMTLQQVAERVRHGPSNYALFMAQEVEAAIPHLENRVWLVGHNTSQIPLITSDAPVRPYTDQEGISGLAFPLSPEYVLLMVEREKFSNPDSRDRTVFRLKEEFIHNLNLLQLEHCHEQVYSPQDIWESLL